MTRTHLLLGTAVLGLLLGCSGPGEGPTTADTGELPAQGPLEEILGWAATTGGAADVIAAEAQRERWMAACMAKEGFDYHPQVPTADDITALEGPARGTREFVERYGYGMWTPVTEEEGGYMFETEDDPEYQAYLAAMSPAELDAYMAAMYGAVTETRSDGSESRSGGCIAVSFDGIGDQDPYLSGVRDAATQFLDALPEDPGFAELDARWSECMAGEGLGYASPLRAQDSFLEGLEELYAKSSEQNVHPFSLPEVPERAAEEKRVALADLECRESLGYDRLHTLIAHELQADYVEAHRAELDALAEVLGVGEA